MSLRQPRWQQSLSSPTDLLFELPEYATPPGGEGPSGRLRTSVSPNWKSWLRSVERKRRKLGESLPLTAVPCDYLGRVTLASFQIDGINLTEAEIIAALRRGSGAKAVQPRQAQRIRNHVAILRRIPSLVARGSSLTANMLVRWYTSISCGLCTTGLDAESVRRLESIATRLNFPHLHLRQAIEEIVRLYQSMLLDPVVPSFNGILCRLLLMFQLNRCGVPPVVFRPDRDRVPPDDDASFLRRLLERIDESYELLLSRIQ